MQRIVV